MITIYSVAYETENAWGVDEGILFSGSYAECVDYIREDGGNDLYIVEG